MYLTSYTPNLVKLSAELSVITVDNILVVTPGSLKIPLTLTKMVASPFNTIVGIAGSLVITTVLVFVTTLPNPSCDVYKISYCAPSIVESPTSPVIVMSAPVSVTAPGST